LNSMPLMVQPCAFCTSRRPLTARFRLPKLSSLAYFG
jgi:hypothetical protein